MPAPPTSSPQDELGDRLFSFYPPIRQVEYNEWRFLNSTWSEVLVENERATIQVWIPRRFLGALSSVDEPFPIVGLTKELEYRAGSVFPYHAKVLEMPRDSVRKNEAVATQAPPSGGGSAMLRSSKNEGSVFRLIGIAVVVSMILLLSVVIVYRGGSIFQRSVILSTSDQDYLTLGAGDDYFTITKRLGEPSDDRWRTQSKEVSFRVLEYPNRSYSVILFGADKNSATYIGTLDRNWRPIHSVNLGRGVDSAAMLRTLPRF